MKRTVLHSVFGGFALFLSCLLAGVITDTPAMAAGTSDAPSAETAAAPAVLKVGFPQVEGFSETDEFGGRHGLVVDYLTEIAKYTGWEYEYIDTGGDEMINDFIAGKYDLAGGFYYSAGLEEYFAYPDYNTGSTKSVLLARWDDSSIHGYDLRTLNGKKIGVYERAVENVRRLNEFLSMNGLNCVIQTYGVEDLIDGRLYHKLESGEVDVLLGNAGDDNGKFCSVTYFDAQPHYIVTTPDRTEILDGLNYALGEITESNPNFREERYEANFPETSAISVFLNDEEKEYIREKKTVTVAVPYNCHPLFCMNESQDLHNGMVPDVLDSISRFSGLRFSYVSADTYAQALKMVKSGEADMAGFFLGSESEASEAGLSLTKSYITLSNMLVRNKSVSYPSEGLTGAVLSERRIPNEIKADKVVYFDTVSEALAAVDRKEVDFFYGMTTQIERELQEHHLTNSVPVSLVNYNNDICFALTKPAKAQLLTIMNKSISNLTEKELSSMVNRNMVSVGGGKLSLSDMIYGNPILAILIILIILILTIAVITITAHSRVRNTVLRAEMEKTEADSRAKSEFLSRMSHEIRTPMNAIVGLSELVSVAEDVPGPVKTNLVKLRSSAHYLLYLINDILDMSRIDSNKMSIASEPFSLLQMVDDFESMIKAEADRNGQHLSIEKDIRHPDLSGDAIRLRQVLTNLLSNALKFTPLGGHVTLRIMETASDDSGATFLFQVIDDGIGIAKEEQERIFDAFEQCGNNAARSRGTGLGLPISRSIVELMGGELNMKSSVGEGSEFYFSITLPYGVPTRKNTDIPPADMLDNVRFLLAEDNELNAEITTELLQLKGARIMRVANGSEAVKTFSESAAGTFDAILMDIQMPVMNGLEAARAIRAMERDDAADIPIVAMTANSFKEDIDAAMEAGMNAFITKPLDVDCLYSVLCNILKIRIDL